jgi:mannose-6-phosphate isomerase-like protein (cupin superfamily)
MPSFPSVREWRDVDARVFREEIVPAGRPAILRELAADWPAVRTEDPAAYLKRFDQGAPQDAIRAAPEIEGRFGYTPDMAAFNFERGKACVSEVLDHLMAIADDAAPPGIAIQAVPVDIALPGFSAENPMPLTVARPRVWIGNRVVVATHHDVNSNVAVVMAGRRRFTLFPPDQVGNLYLGPFEFTPAGTPISLADPEAPDLERFPRLAEALRYAETADLAPGDALYVPHMWWHHVRSLDPLSILVNYWWDEASTRHPGLAPFNVLLHALLAFEDVPQEQRNAWAAMFAHFVFHADGVPAGHVPEVRRGIQGPMGADTKERLRRQIAAILAR